MDITIIDYGMGNLRSVQKAFEKAGARATITNEAGLVAQAERLVLPGVGAMAPAMQKLHELGLMDIIRDFVTTGKPFLGICLGFQLLFSRSTEGGDVPGLNLLTGTVERFPPGQKVPHIGWNALVFQRDDCPLWKGLPLETYVYFCHSYYVKPDKPEITASLTEYGRSFSSSVWDKNVFGVQFHPEKSQDIGLRILKNFIENT
ncbi:MAG TPA: imidazole glycerol phosphate synthase subunit HisH [Candidatus Omnitrophota bacterium]|nr:imidazole glycerol phosphate synthase subunit HisH [Candidatus Omnitrophota bacterium]HPN56937.1 imidazole glycerol phosphate synthase subunit HisH [Candidatus Omnitrophota bacterium]